MKKILFAGFVALLVAAEADAKGPIRRFLFGDGCRPARAAAACYQPAQYAPAPRAYQTVPFQAFEPVPAFQAASPLQPVTFTYGFPVVNAVRSACQNGQCPLPR